MSGYSESALLKKLEDLKIASISIQGVSLWIMHHKKHYKATVKTWYNHLVGVTGGERKLNLLYLANDVVQNARKKHPETGIEFGSVMKKVFGHLAGVELDTKTMERIARLVHVWKERLIFEKEVLDEISRIWKKKFGEVTTTTSQQAPVKPKHKPTSQERAREPSEPSVKKARVEAVVGNHVQNDHHGDLAGGEEDLVNALIGLQRLVAGQTEDLARVQNLPDTCEEHQLDDASFLLSRCTARLQEEVEERRRVGEILADLVRRQQEQLLEAESRLVGLRRQHAVIQKLQANNHSFGDLEGGDGQ